jgi:hypothetical protein
LDLLYKALHGLGLKKESEEAGEKVELKRLEMEMNAP